MFTTISFLLLLILTSPIAAYTSLPYNFTLAALNQTLPNANSTGAPLVLGQNGATDGEEFEVTSTYASFPYNDWPELALVDTSIHAFHTGGYWITNATQTMSGGALSWLTSSFDPPATAATGYSAVQTVTSAQVAVTALAYNDESGLWSLCPFDGGQTNVVFNVSADTSVPPEELGFDPAECYPVILNIVQV